MLESQLQIDELREIVRFNIAPGRGLLCRSNRHGGELQIWKVLYQILRPAGHSAKNKWIAAFENQANISLRPA